MSVGVGPISAPFAATTRSCANDKPTTTSRRSDPAPALRLPEDRAFDVATINRRLARMAEQAGSTGARIDLKL